MKKRQTANLEILNILLHQILDFPEERFSQILYNSEAVQRGLSGQWVDEFYLESTDLFQRMKVKNE
jgi:hypothetical protein